MDPKVELYVTRAKENRAAFLTPYREAFKNADTPQQRAEIVIELLMIEPSHIEEPWIAGELAKWMRQTKSLGYCERAIIAQKGRDRPTPQQQIQRAFDFFTYRNVQNISQEEAISADAAMRLLAERVSEQNTDYLDQHGTIRKRYYRYKKTLKARQLPCPYWGKDIFEDVQDGQRVIMGRVYGAKVQFTATGKEGDINVIGTGTLTRVLWRYEL